MDDIWQALGLFRLQSLFVRLTPNTSFNARDDERDEQVQT